MKNNNKKNRREKRLERSAKIAHLINASLALSVASLSYALLFPMPFSVSAEDKNITFQVNVRETLSVSLTTPDVWASGTPTANADSGFLRNTVSLNVTSNNATGFTASMYADTSDSTHTSLVNTIDSTETLPTMTTSQQKSAFTANYWGYSLDATGTNVYNNKTYNETDAGNNSSEYHPLTTSSSPETILTGTGSTTGSRQIYFGAKADSTQAAGTYTGSVVISVVTGEVKDGNTGNEPTVPDNPVTPTDDTPDDNTATYISQVGSNGVTVYTTRSSNVAQETETVATQITDGDVTSSYPLGVKENVSTSISSGSSLATGLAVTATTAAATGLIFFIIAKRREDDDEEEPQDMV